MNVVREPSAYPCRVSRSASTTTDRTRSWCRGPNVFNGYWRDRDASAAAFDGEGWLRTGDLGEVDSDGYLRIVGRSKELIITGGYDVHAREVEEVLVRHPSVSEVAVIGLPSDEWGEVVTAVVVPRGRAEGARRVGPDELRRRRGWHPTSAPGS